MDPAAPRFAALAAGALILAACPGGAARRACPDGQIEDSATGQCVQARCGAGDWGLVSRDAATVHVAPWGSASGDGSEAEPLDEVQAAVDQAGDAGGGLVVLSAGSWERNLDLTSDHQGVRIVGRCPELVALDGGSDAPAVRLVGADVDLFGLTLRGGLHGLEAWGDASIELSASRLEEPQLVGVLVAGAGTVATLRDVQVSGGVPADDGTLGYGIWVGEGARLEARGLLVEASGDSGLVAVGDGTRVELEDATIRGVLPRADGSYGRGIEVGLQASLEARSLLIEECAEMGLRLADAGTTAVLEDAVVRRTAVTADGVYLRGVDVDDGASLQARGLVLEDNRGAGLAASRSAAVQLQQTTVRRALPGPDGVAGFGLLAQLGGRIVAEDLLVEDCHEAGIAANAPGSRIELDRATVRGTAPGPGREASAGLAVAHGAELVGADLEIEANRGSGVSVAGAGARLQLEAAVITGTRSAVSGLPGRAAQASDEGLLLLTGTRVEDNFDVGVAASGAGTRVELESVSVTGTRSSVDSVSGVGVAVQDGARVSGSTLELAHNEGPGLYVVTGGGLEATDVVLDGNAFAGAVVAGGGELVLTGGSVASSSEHASEGGGLGVFAWGIEAPPRVELDGLVFTDLVGPALYLRGTGRYRVRDCRTSETGWDERLPGGVLALEGVSAWTSVELGDPAAEGLLLVACRFEDIPGDALLLDSASATLAVEPESGLPNSFAAVDGAPLVWQRCDGVEPPQVLDGSLPTPSCESTPRTLGQPLEYRLWLAEAEPVE